MNLDDRDVRSAAAGEYVLGPLAGDERAAFVRRLHGDRALQAEVGYWQDRLLGLAAHVAPIEPSPGVWPRIAASIGATARDAAGAAQRAAAADAPAERQAAPAGQPTEPWWQRLALWHSIAGLAIAASLVLATLLLVGTRPEPPARYIALLRSPTQQVTGWIVEASAGGTLRLVPVAPGDAVPAGRALQFWTKPQGASGPTSLGLVRAGERLELPTARLPALGAEQLFEITLESEAGSPIGRPTGPILYVGTAMRL